MRITPDVPFNFLASIVSLQPGACWTIRHSLDNIFWAFPKDFATGGVFRYRYEAGTVEWWEVDLRSRIMVDGQSR